ncbi:MAG TPA: hypothetical protein VFM18_17240 [Methanosarcina sp.]|nr:hypothetical protein [Methanosarcina sp.]
MKIRDVITEGGWANPITQNTKITPALVKQAVVILHHFTKELNKYLATKNIPPVELGAPCGSTTYYQRDLAQDPTREYGDIDVNFHIPRIEGMSNNANAKLITDSIKEFCDNSTDYQTANGTNVVFKIGSDYIQIDFITSYYENKEWTKALAPEYRVKGVLTNSVYSSLGECLNLSIGGGHGVQAKFQDGHIVPFRTTKNVELKTITNNPKTWAIDIAKFFGCKKMSKRLQAYPGMLDEIRVADIINSIVGIAETLEMNDKLPGEFPTASDLLKNVKGVYLAKIDKAIASTKFEKAETPAAIKKAEETKELLATKSRQFASLFDKGNSLA